MTPAIDPEIHLEQADDGTFVATSAALPGYVARGDTESTAIRRMRKALKLAFKEQERDDFLRLSPREERGTSFRWSRYRTPLDLRLPLSRRVKLNLAAFGAGFLVGVSAGAALRRG
ncbi:MAG: type II toxin-antitoxin system HicB family antitoxin [Gemmatimonadota bacterium]